MSVIVIKRLKNMLKAQASYIKDDKMLDVYQKVDSMNIIEDLMDVLDKYEKEYCKEKEDRDNVK